MESVTGEEEMERRGRREERNREGRNRGKRGKGWREEGMER